MKEITNMDDRLNDADKKIGEYKVRLDEMKKQADQLKQKLTAFDVHIKRIDDLKAFADMTGRKLEKG